MEKDSFFAAKLGVRPHDFITVVGGGGKTSLLRHLAGELLSEGHQILLTTTTCMQVPEEDVYTVLLRDKTEPVQYVRAAMACRASAVFAAEYRISEKKAKGSEDGLPDLLYEKLQDRTFLCEGDGSAGYSFKIFREHEPVIPKASTRVIFIAGADVWGQPCREVLFRCPDRCRDRIFDERFWREELDNALGRIRMLYDGPVDLLINKAEKPRRGAALRMSRIAKEQEGIRRSWIASLQEGRIDAV